VRRRDGRLACRRLVEPSIPHPSLQSTRRLEEMTKSLHNEPQRPAVVDFEGAADHPIQAHGAPLLQSADGLADLRWLHRPPYQRPICTTTMLWCQCSSCRIEPQVVRSRVQIESAGCREYDRQHSQSVAKPTRSAAV
jgi:hypothetical protein